MNRKEAFEYLTGDIAISYRPKRMPWEHDQDSADTQKQVLNQWVTVATSSPTQIIQEAFGMLIRHNPSGVPTLNEFKAHVRRLEDQHDVVPRRGGASVMAPETGLCVAYEAYCDELARQGRSPDETRFTKKFNAMFGGR